MDAALAQRPAAPDGWQWGEMNEGWVPPAAVLPTRGAVTAHVEPWQAVQPELRPRLPTHYAELSMHQGRHALDPQWDAYARRDADGSLLFVALRRDGRLIGYFIGFVQWGLHYRTCLTLLPDIFFIVPDERGGLGALRLFRAVEREARRRGVALWMVGEKRHKPAGRLFRAMGFEPAETLWWKWLDAPASAKEA